MMLHYWIIGGGMLLGIIVLNFLNKYEKPKQKVKIEDNLQTETEQSNLKNDDQNETKIQKENQIDDEQVIRKRKLEQEERKNKLFKNLSKEDREMVEEFFQKKAKQYVTGEVDKSDRRITKLLTIIKVALYILFGIMVYLGLTIAFNTSSPMMILENIKFLVKSFLQQLFSKN